jgi:hypothetical protein
MFSPREFKNNYNQAAVVFSKELLVETKTLEFKENGTFLPENTSF